MGQHLENTKQMLFNETSDDFEFNANRYLFAENPIVHLDIASGGVKRSVSVKYKMSVCVNPLATLLCDKQNQSSTTHNFYNGLR